MAIPRRNYGRTASILAICAIATGIWLFGRGETESPPRASVTTPDHATAGESQDPLGVAELDGAIGKRRKPTPPNGQPTTDTVRPATVEVELTSETPNEIRTMAIDTFSPDGNQALSHASGRSIATGSIATIEVPALTRFRLTVTVNGAAALSRRLRLAPGEHHRIVAALAPHVAVMQIVGPSAELLPHLQLEITDRGIERPTPIVAALDDSGSARVRVAGPAIAKIRTTHQTTIPTLTTTGQSEFEPGPGVVKLTPHEPLLGIRVQANGAIVPARIHLNPLQFYVQPLRDDRGQTRCTIVRRERAERTPRLAIVTTAGGSQFANPEDARRLPDVWTFSIHDLTTVGELRVRFETEAADTANDRTPTRAQLWAQSLTSDERQRLAPAHDRDGLVAYLPIGDYRLFWLPTPEHEESAMDFVRIDSNAPTEITLLAKRLQRWDIRYPDAPTGVTLALEWPDDCAAGFSDNGHFTADLGRSPRVGEPATLVLEQQERKFPAEFATVDPGKRRATIRSRLSEAREVAIRIEPLATGGEPDLRLAGASLGIHRAWLLPGDRLQLHATEIVDDQRQMLGWFEITAEHGTMTLHPRGHWATMRFERARGSATILHAGSRSGTPPVYLKLRPQTTPFRLFVADGTAAIHVEVDGVRQTFGTNLSEFVVR